jgi:hypothetical protein
MQIVFPDFILSTAIAPAKPFSIGGGSNYYEPSKSLTGNINRFSTWLPGPGNYCI